jgi:hypothetical protein
MSYDKVLADKSYANSIIEKCYEDEPSKFEEYDTTFEELKDLVNTSRFIDDNKIYEGKKCVVVASGGSVLEKELGHKIDNFDLVVRANLAQFEGFEKHVGSRTDVRFMSHKAFGNTLKNTEFSAYDINYVPNSNSHLIIRSVGNIGSVIPGLALNKDGNNKFSILDLDCWDYMNEPLNSKDYGTVGYSAVITMMLLGCEVSIYGFDFFDGSSKYHYYESVAPHVQTGGPNHPMGGEKQYLNYLIELGKIKKLV